MCLANRQWSGANFIHQHCQVFIKPATNTCRFVVHSLGILLLLALEPAIPVQLVTYLQCGRIQ